MHTTSAHKLELAKLETWLSGELKRLKQKQHAIVLRYDLKKQRIIKQHIQTKIKDL